MDGFVLFRPYILLYSILAIAVAVLFRSNQASRLWLYRLIVPAAVAAMVVYALKILASMLDLTLSGSQFVSPGSYISVLVLITALFAGRFFLLEWSLQNTDRVTGQTAPGNVVFLFFLFDFAPADGNFYGRFGQFAHQPGRCGVIPSRNYARKLHTDCDPARYCPEKTAPWDTERRQRNEERRASLQAVRRRRIGERNILG